jgi:outer membrane protein OmpA-like peptidoglycan-associated protein
MRTRTPSAKSVSDYLKVKGVTTEITLGWYADTKPVDSGTSKAALAKNRRVEIYNK